ncbi:tigger transposable element-derived protein 4-like [Tropilaelaps mercedesae]|uniref:Tigger transposable element-derived protein 4-like n=1 Tax=Tropilaelaps mercedesae TaxID=418985 RepID=A0A1V9XBJ0_9ACAR|nr:tigger transposable element-derived protein 4-like [Tropilaelaps mercedesae]
MSDDEPTTAETSDAEPNLSVGHAGAKGPSNGCKSTCKARKDLPLKVQVEVLTKLMAGAKQSQLATEFSVSQSQISRIKSNQERILCQFLNNGNLDRRRARVGPQKELEEELLKWYQDEVSKGTALNGVMLTSRANQLAKELGLADWKPSKGWFYRWRQRNNVQLRTSLASALEPAETEANSGSSALAEFREVLANYAHGNVYVMDEATLLYRTTPSKEGQLFVDPHERVAILFCANRSGSALMPPVLIGRTAEPACLKGVKRYPVLYTNSPGATMTSNIFHGWLQQIDSDCAKTNKKIALVADDIPAHRVPHLVLKNIRLLYLPYHIRPLEKLISKFKLCYRERLLRELAVLCDYSLQRIQQASTISLLRCMHFVKLAWNELTADDVSACIESLIKTVLGVNFQPEENDSATALTSGEVGPLPFGLTSSDLRLVEQLEKQMEIKLDNDASLAVVEGGDFPDEQFMGLKLIPPKKREIHAALEVLRRFYDLNGYDPAPLYRVDETLQQHLALHGLMPRSGPAVVGQQTETCLIAEPRATSAGHPGPCPAPTVVPHPGVSLNHHTHSLGLGAHPQLLTVPGPSTAPAAASLDHIHLQPSGQAPSQHLTQSHVIQLG